MKDLRNSLFTILFIFLGLFLYTRFFGAIPFSVNSVSTTKTDIFKVEGTGKATEIPNTALISIGVTKNAATVLAAQDQTNSTVNKMLSDFKELGIEEKDIKTTNYSVYPNYDYTLGKQTVNGYTVTQNLQIKVKPIDKANQVIDKATENGANIVGGISFVLDDQKQKQLENEAREKAVKEAREKAQSLAKAAGITLGRIIDVQEKSATPRRIGFEPMLSAEKAEGQATQITPGQNTIEITVSLSYETR